MKENKAEFNSPGRSKIHSHLLQAQSLDGLTEECSYILDYIMRQK